MKDGHSVGIEHNENSPVRISHPVWYTWSSCTSLSISKLHILHVNIINFFGYSWIPSCYRWKLLCCKTILPCEDISFISKLHLHNINRDISHILTWVMCNIFMYVFQIVNLCLSPHSFLKPKNKNYRSVRYNNNLENLI